ncbi:MAG: hypothetical protein QOE17_922 [Gaiellales bacterium]|nr:hypothetical protein [Gaiellales bacterium]
MIIRSAIALAASLVAVWLLLVLALAARRPSKERIIEALRLLPDVLRLVRRLAADPELPRTLRLRLWLLLAYLALPFDLIPDFLPVVGYADDAVIVAWTLRAVVRRAGAPALERHWPGSPEGLAAVRRLAGV